MPKNLGSMEFPSSITEETFLPLLLFEYEWHNIMQQEKGGGLSGTLESQNENKIDERSSVMPESPQTRGKWNAHPTSTRQLIGDLEEVRRIWFYGLGETGLAL